MAARNHMMTMSTSGTSVAMIYDGDGNRVGKNVNGVWTYYLVDDMNPTGYSQVVEDLSANGAVTRQYTYGLQRISENQLVNGAWTPSFYGYDGGGNVRNLTNSAGAVTDEYEYDAFGNSFTKVGATPNNYLYRGEQFDSDLGLYYLRARYYNPLTGSFLSRDPEDGYIDLPATLHKYLYAGGDSADGLDPTGQATYTKPAGGLKGIGQSIGEYIGLINTIAIRVLVTTQVAIPAYLRTDQGKALQLLILSGASIAVAESCALITEANRFNEFLEEVATGGAYVSGPEPNCNEQTHAREGGAGSGGWEGGFGGEEK
jgi:RHS repeat-associated protein